MKRNLFKKLAAAAGAAVMALTLVMPMGVSAVESTTYPTSGTGTLTITKYLTTDDSKLDWDESDIPQTEPSGEKLGGVTFSIRKVGSISQEAYDGKIGLLYQIEDGELNKVLKRYRVNADSGTDKYTSTTLNTAIKNNTSDYEAVVIKGEKDKDYQSATTSSDEANKGEAVFSNLNFGLYLVAETETPSTVTGKSVPFFVAIPSIVNATDGNTTWTTNVKAYPKNMVNTPTIDKKIQKSESGGNTTLVNQTNANIGDTITYEIPVTAIVPADGLKQLYIQDQMTKGLTFNKDSVTIYKMDFADDRNFVDDKKVEAANYTVQDPVNVEESTDKMVKISFTETYLATLDSTSYFRIVYTCTLNTDAVLGQTGNTNKVKLYYSNSTSTENVPNVPGTTEPKVFTYGIDLVKSGERNTFLKDVQFTLTKQDGTAINVTEKGSAPNTYYTPASTASSNTVTTNASGKISIRGLAPGTYKLTETKTNSGYVLLKDPITVAITQTSAETGAANAKVNNADVSMTSDELNENSATAKVPLNVVNNKGFDLPQTGAAGTAIFAIIGIAIVAAAGALLVFRRKTGR